MTEDEGFIEEEQAELAYWWDSVVDDEQAAMEAETRDAQQDNQENET